MKRAQAGVEGMIAVGIIFFLFMGVYLVYIEKQHLVTLTNQELQEHRDCLLLSNAITTILILGEGSQTTVRIKYNQTIYPLQQRIESENSFCTIPVKSVSNSGYSSTAPFNLAPGNVVISRSDWVKVQNG
ncbi:hypothetical protein J4444_00610 [Candidatus Woesearchaeota archaeon]|nr:hypothetical protein [Candidatus Woesearchaeota archaeon]